MEFKSLYERYKEKLAKSVDVLVDDLTDTELKLIEESYDMFIAKIEEISVLEKDIKRLINENLNLKSMLD